MSVLGTSYPASYKRTCLPGASAKMAQRTKVWESGRAWPSEAQVGTSTPRPGQGASAAGANEPRVDYLLPVFVLTTVKSAVVHGEFLNLSKAGFPTVSSLTQTVSTRTLVNRNGPWESELL